MAIQVSGTNVITNARALNNITSIDATTAAAFTTAGVGASGPDWTLVNTVSDSTERSEYYNSSSYTYTIPTDAVELLLQWEGTIRAVSTPNHMQGISLGALKSSNTNWYDGARKNFYRYSYDTTYRYGKIGVPIRLKTVDYSLDTSNFASVPDFDVYYGGVSSLVSSSSVQEWSFQNLGSHNSTNHPFAPGETMKYGYGLGGNSKMKNVTFKLYVNRGAPVQS